MYKKYLTWLGETIIFSPRRENSNSLTALDIFDILQHYIHILYIPGVSVFLCKCCTLGSLLEPVFGEATPSASILFRSLISLSRLSSSSPRLFLGGILDDDGTDVVLVLLRSKCL